MTSTRISSNTLKSSWGPKETGSPTQNTESQFKLKAGYRQSSCAILVQTAVIRNSSMRKKTQH
nr:transcription activator protein [Cotton leaf curl Burewala virus]CCO61990.1 transcription activator protein [Cotton leaf curl Burewala virus]